MIDVTMRPHCVFYDHSPITATSMPAGKQYRPYAKRPSTLQDYAKAVRLYRLAADHGHAAAQSQLAWMYISGKGVPRNYAKGLKLYHLAADQGDAGAQKALGLFYLTAFTVSRRVSLRLQGGIRSPPIKVRP